MTDGVAAARRLTAGVRYRSPQQGICELAYDSVIRRYKFRRQRIGIGTTEKLDQSRAFELA